MKCCAFPTGKCAAQKTAIIGGVTPLALDEENVGRPTASLLSAGGEDFTNESFLSQHMPYLTYVSDDIMMLKEGDLLATLRLDGVNPMTTQDTDLDALKKAVAAIVAVAGNTFGFYVHRISVPQNLGMEPVKGDSFAAEIDKAWQSHIADLGPKKRSLYLTVVRRPNIAARLPLLRKFATRNYRKDRRVRTQHLNEVMNFFKEALSAAKPVRLTREGGEWLGYLGALNYGRFSPIAEGKGMVSLAAQASNCRATFNGDLVTIRDEVTGQLRYGAVFAMKNYPAITDVTMLDGLDLPVDVVLTNSFTPIPNNIMGERMQRIIRQMKASDDAAVSLRDQLEEAADDLESGRITFGNHHLSVAVYAESQDLLEKAVAQVKRVAQEISAVVVRENMALKATYFAQHPGNFSYRPRATPISSTNFAEFAALHGSVEGRPPEQSPWSENITVFPTVGASGYRFNFHLRGDPKKEPTAGHTLVLGTMGTGKTLTTAFLVAQAQRMKARVFFFDKDNGLEMAIRAMGGAYNQIRAGVPTGLNPLATETDSRGQAWLSDWLSTLMSRKGELNGDQARALQLAIRQNATADRSLQNFQSFEQLFRSLDHNEELQSRIGEWNSGGRFGWVFEDVPEGENDLQIDGDLVGFDMTEILDMDTERTAVLSYIFRQIERVVEDRRPTIILLDEAWKYLDDEYFVQRLDNWAVTMRKLDVILVMLTQLPSQLEKSRIGKTIVETASTQILFPNPKAAAQDYHYLRLNEKEAELLVQPTLGLRTALIRSDEDSVFIDADLSSLGDLLPVLGGGTTGEEFVGEGWRNRKNFWSKK